MTPEGEGFSDSHGVWHNWLWSDPGTDRGRYQRACYRVMLRHEAEGGLPTSGRFVYYELKQAGGDGGGEYDDITDGKVSDALTHLRVAGLIPWEWVTDETRRISVWAYGESVRDHVLSELGTARIDCWGWGVAPMVICESRGMAAVLSGVAAAYLCPVTATAGQAGGFLHTSVAPALEKGQPVLYFGDHNPAGSHIEQNTRRVLERATGGELEWERVAVTEELAAERNLPPKPGTDKRYRGGLEHLSYECEALGQAYVQGMLRDILDELLPAPLRDVLDREEEQREQVRALLDRAL